MPNKDRRNYGGFPIRSEIVKERRTEKYGESDKLDTIFIEQYALCQCSLEQLKMPILISKTGKLFNKDQLFEFFIAKANHESTEKLKDEINKKELEKGNDIKDQADKPSTKFNKLLDKLRVLVV